MSRQASDVDLELIELFADDPGALAIADALQATQHTRSSQARAKLLVAAAAVVLGAVAAGTFAVTRSGAGVIEHALAVWPANRVVALKIEDIASSETLVDPNTGLAQPLHHVVSEWYNPKTHTRRVVDRVAGVVVSDKRVQLAHGNASARAGFTNDALAAFPYLYRHELSLVSDQAVSRAVLGGEPVFWVHFKKPSVLAAVAINRMTYQPTQIVFRNGSRSRRFDVVKASVLSAGVPVPSAMTVARLPSTSPRISPLAIGSAAALQSATVHAARTLHQLTITSVRTGRFANATGFYVRLRTSAKPSALFEVQEATQPEQSFGWSPARVAATRDGLILVERGGAFVTAYVSARGRYFRIWTDAGSSEAQALARQLTLR